MIYKTQNLQLTITRDTVSHLQRFFEYMDQEELYQLIVYDYCGCDLILENNKDTVLPAHYVFDPRTGKQVKFKEK